MEEGRGGGGEAEGGIKNVAVVSVFVIAGVTICSFSQLLPMSALHK